MARSEHNGAKLPSVGTIDGIVDEGPVGLLAEHDGAGLWETGRLKNSSVAASPAKLD